MKTDLPLKRVTRLRPQDILRLVGVVDADVVGVETLELPVSKTSLDTVVRVRSVTGADELYLIEWQGYADPAFLWRTMGYLAWLGQNRSERPIRATIIYLHPADDVGTTLDQASTEAGGWQLTFPCVRLWEQDASAILASGLPGLLALTPLMHGATSDMVEHAAHTLLEEVSQPTQGELLAALGIFAEPIFDTERFIRLVTKERLMATDLISILTADLEEEKAALEHRNAALTEQLLTVQAEQTRHHLQQVIEEIIVERFPSAPARLTHKLRQIIDPQQLAVLHRAILQAGELADVELAIDTALKG